MPKRISTTAAALAVAAGCAVTTGLLAPAARADFRSVISADAQQLSLHASRADMIAASLKAEIMQVDRQQRTIGWRSGVIATTRGRGALAVLHIPDAAEDADTVAVRLSDPTWDPKTRRATFRARRVHSTAGTPLAAWDKRLDDRIDTSAGPVELRLVKLPPQS